MYAHVHPAAPADTVFEFLHIPKRDLNYRLFGFFTDKHLTGKLTFLSFVAPLWHFLSFNDKW